MQRSVLAAHMMCNMGWPTLAQKKKKKGNPPKNATLDDS